MIPMLTTIPITTPIHACRRGGTYLARTRAANKLFALGTNAKKGGNPGTPGYILSWPGKQIGNSGLN